MPPLELRGPLTGLLDDPIALVVSGAAPGEALTWRARLRDDDDRVWRSTAPSAAGLGEGWAPAKPQAGRLPALRSLRPVRIDVRVEAPDGRAATRTLTRLIVGPGVRVRRWRDATRATLHLPAHDPPTATLLLDAREPADHDVAALAAPLLASRGALVLAAAGDLELAAERLAALPGATTPEVRAPVPSPGLPMRRTPVRLSP